MWLHIWVETTKSIQAFYKICKERYTKYTTFSKLVRIRVILSKCLSIDPCWEIPKGRRENGETLQECAVREISEETGINYGDYRIIGSQPKIFYSYQYKNTIYVNKYFVGVLLNYKVAEGVSFSNKKQIAEISDARWVSLKNMKHIPLQHKNLYKQSKKILKIFKSIKY